MNDSMICDDRANDEADRHAQMMQIQREESKSDHALELGRAVSLLADSATER